MVDTEVDRGNMEVEKYPAAEVCCRLHIDAATVKGRDCAIERVRRPPPNAMAHELEAFWPPPAQRLESTSVWHARASGEHGTGVSHRRVLQTVRSQGGDRHAVRAESAKLHAAVRIHDTG